MKCVILLCAFAALALAQYNNIYTIPAAPCAWHATAEYESFNARYTMKVAVYGLYSKVERYNNHGDIYESVVTRADYDEKGKAAKFTWDGLHCSVAYVGTGGLKYSGLGFYSESRTFKYVEKAKYNGKDCMCYYDDGLDNKPNKSEFAVYVGDDGFVRGIVSKSYDRTLKYTVNFTDYGTHVTMDDFTMSTKYAYACVDDRVFHKPAAYWAQCSASTTGAALAVVLVALVSALVSLF